MQLALQAVVAVLILADLVGDGSAVTSVELVDELWNEVDMLDGFLVGAPALLSECWFLVVQGL